MSTEETAKDWSMTAFLEHYGTHAPAILVREVVIRAHCGGLTEELQAELDAMLDHLTHALQEGQMLKRGSDEAFTRVWKGLL